MYTDFLLSFTRKYARLSLWRPHKNSLLKLTGMEDAIKRILAIKRDQRLVDQVDRVAHLANFNPEGTLKHTQEFTTW